MRTMLFLTLMSAAGHIHAESVVVRVCRSIAGGAQELANLKAKGKTEGQIREMIFAENAALKSAKDRVLPLDTIDSVTESKIENLIFVFDPKNARLTPES